MKVQYYTVNVKGAKDNTGRQLVIYAVNKKEAEKFCKEFEGLKIIDSCRKKYEQWRFNNSNDLMSAQKELLAEKLQLNELYIEN